MRRKLTGVLAALAALAMATAPAAAGSEVGGPAARHRTAT